MPELFDDRPEFENRNGTILHYIEHGSKRMSCWEVISKTSSQMEARMHIIPFTDVTEEELKRLEIWDEIDHEIQKTIKIIDECGEQELEREIKKDQKEKEKLQRREREKKGLPEEKPKRKRRSLDEFKDYPEFLTCKCGRETKANYSYLAKKAEKEGVPVMDLVNSYVCQTCNPTKGRGRKRNPAFDGLPEFLECKCGKQVRANYSQLSKKAEREGKTLRQLIDTYQCQKCNPTKGRKKARKSI